MKTLVLFVLLILKYVCCDKVYTSYGLWNENGQAQIGMINLPTAETKILATVPGYSHFESNQYSTYNSHTNIISFLVYSNSSQDYSFFQYNIQENKVEELTIDFSEVTKIYGIASSNNTNEEDDIYFIYESINDQTILGKLNESTGSISNKNKLEGTFCSAAYDSRNSNYYTLFNINGVYTLEIFTRDASTSTGTVALKFPNKNQLNITSDPYNLVYLESFDTFYFWIDLNSVPSLFTVNNAVIIQSNPGPQYIFTNKKAYAMASTNLVDQNNQEFFQAVEIKHNNYAGNSLINTYNNQGEFVNSYPTKTLPINMWIY